MKRSEVKSSRSKSRKTNSKPKLTEPVLSAGNLDRATPKETKPAKTAELSRVEVVNDLPKAYRDGRFVLLARDPFWLYCYWDLTPKQEKKLWSNDNPALRLVEIVDTREERELKRFALSHGAHSWYIQVDTSNKIFRTELGQVDIHGQFLSIISSNVMSTPRETVSPKIESKFATVSPKTAAAIAPIAPPTSTTPALTPRSDSFTEERPPIPNPAHAQILQSASPPVSERPRPYPAPALQPVSPDTAERFFQHSVGVPSQRLGGGDLPEALWEKQERLSPQLFSDVLFSAAWGQDRSSLGKDYWLAVDADLIVYGATAPGSQVSVLGSPLHVDDEGHFSARFTLPDGQRDIPIEGVSPDQELRKGASMRVERSTTRW